MHDIIPGIKALTNRLWLMAFEAQLQIKYDPDQARVPAGNPDGGQWTSEGGGDAIHSSGALGNVTQQLGKYGTLQNFYKGSNGVTAIVETEGRNAGKVITVYRH